MGEFQPILLSGNEKQINHGQIFAGLSLLINGYTTDVKTTGEMISKTSDQLADAFYAGLSQVYLDEEQNPIAHAAAWPLLNEKQFGFRLYEFGSWIVDPKYRHHKINGLTIGESIAFDLTQSVLNYSHDNTPTGFIATVKRDNSLRGLLRAGFQILSFSQLPFLTSLTCSCSTVSEHYQNRSCPHRRSPNFGEIIIKQNEGNIYQFQEFYLPNGPDSKKIPCTLLGCGDFAKIELKLLNLYHQLTSGEYYDSDTINPATIKEIGRFYSNLGITI